MKTKLLQLSIANLTYDRNPSVSISPTLIRNEKVEHYIKIKTHKPIVLRFWVQTSSVWT